MLLKFFYKLVFALMMVLIELKRLSWNPVLVFYCCDDIQAEDSSNLSIGANNLFGKEKPNIWGAA